MKTVWRTLVSASVIAAIGAGCGGGSGGGDAPGVTSPSVGGKNAIDSPILTPLVEFYRHSGSDPGGMDYETPTLVGNDNGDLLLVWDNRIDGKVRSMFYHPDSGWSAPEVVLTKPVATTAFGKFGSWIDNQSNAVIQENSLNASKFHLHAGGPWKEADQLKADTDISFSFVENLGGSPFLPDNSELGVAFVVGYPPSSGLIADMRYPIVLRLKSDGKWDKLPPTPVLTPGEAPLADCAIACITSVKAAVNNKGNLVLAFVARNSGIRAVKFSNEQGWGDVAILDTTSINKPSSVKSVAIGSSDKAAVLWLDGINNNLKLALHDNHAFGLANIVPNEFNEIVPIGSFPRNVVVTNVSEEGVSMIETQVETNGQYGGSLAIDYVPGRPWGSVAGVQFNGYLLESDRISFGWIAGGYALGWQKQDKVYVQQYRKTGWTAVSEYPLIKSNSLDFTMGNSRFAVSGTNLVGVIRGRDGLHSVQWPIQ